MDDRDTLRATVWQKYLQYIPKQSGFGVICPWCRQVIQNDYALHEWMVKRNAVRPANQHLIMVPENCIPIHNFSCHMPHGNSAEMRLRCLYQAARAMTARAIGEWYVSLWKEHGLSVPRGTLVAPGEKPTYTHRALCDVGRELLGDPPIEPVAVDVFDVRDMAYAAWIGKMKRFKKQGARLPPSLNKGRLIRYCVEGYWYDYLEGIVLSGLELTAPLSSHHDHEHPWYDAGIFDVGGDK